MRFAVAALVAVFMLFAGLMLAGAGHGWVSGGFGCVPLAPIASCAWYNAIGPAPSRRSAVATLALGLAVCLVVAIASRSEGAEYFLGYWRVSGLAGVLVGGAAYVNWLFASVLAIFRARRSLQSGA